MRLLADYVFLILYIFLISQALNSLTLHHSTSHTYSTIPPHSHHHFTITQNTIPPHSHHHFTFTQAQFHSYTKHHSPSLTPFHSHTKHHSPSLTPFHSHTKHHSPSLTPSHPHTKHHSPSLTTISLSHKAPFPLTGSSPRNTPVVAQPFPDVRLMR